MKTKPASAAPDFALTISTAAFISVCSASMITNTATAKRVPRPIERSATASSISACAGPSQAASSTGASRSAADGSARRCRCTRAGTRTARRTSETNGATAIPIAIADWPGADADRRGEREQEARGRLEEHEPAVEREALVPGQPAAREVAAGVGEHADDEHPVQRRRAVEEVVLDLRAAAPARRPGTAARSASWIVAGTRSGWPSSPRARRSAIVRDSSCSIGR